jgi:predicted permease
LHEAVVQDVRRGLWLLFGSVAVLLLIACVNVANLQLVRGVAKQAEVAVRASVGATRWQIAKHLLAESAVLSVLGGMVGLWLTSVATYLFPLASAVLGPRVEQLGVDTAVISFAVALTLVVGVVFGLAPLLRASSASPAWVVGGAARRSTPVETLRLHRTLVAAEVGFALILLIGGGSLLKSLVALTQEELGMERDDVVSLQVSLRGERYASAAKRGQFFDALVQRADALPGVVSAAAIKPQPLSMQREGIPYEVEGVAPAPERPLMAELSYVSPAYFATIGIPLLAGRAFSERDSSQAPAVVIIDETLAARHWPGKDPLGKRIRTAGWDRSAPWMEVVGIVGHAKNFGFARTSWVQLYVPSAQRQPWSMAVMVRAETGHAAIATGLQDAAHALDPALPISSARTLTGYFDKSISSQRLWTVVLGLFAAVALLHASLGVYGVMAYSVAQRRSEIAIRIALGARSADVLRMISRQGIVPVMIGVGAGLAAGGALAPLLASQLHGVSPGDPITMAVSTIILCATSTVATLMPALKASRVDPGEMLRTE